MKKWIRMPALAGCFALALGSSAAWAQAAPQQPGSGTTGASPGTRTMGPRQEAPPGQTGTATGAVAPDQNGSMGNDKVFVKKAMEGGMAEVTLGQMAAEKGNSPDVKQFGQKMVDDHTKLNDQIKPIASQMGLTPPSDLSKKDKELKAKLEGLSGDQFDKAYMEAMVKDHRKDLKEFQNEASMANNPQVKDAALQGAQMIEQHLQMAEQVAQQVGAGNGKYSKNSSTSSSTPGTTTSPGPQ